MVVPVSGLSNTSNVERSDSLRSGSPSIGIGGSLTTPPLHTTVRTGPYTAVRRVKRAQRKDAGVRGHRGKRWKVRFERLWMRSPATPRVDMHYTQTDWD